MLYDSPQEDLPVIIDSNLKYVASRGIEIRELKFVHISLKNVMRDVKLEKYEFVPFQEQKAIETVDYNELEQYIKDCDTMARSIILAGNKLSTQRIIDENIARILNQNLSSEQILLNVLVNCFKCIVDENGNIIGDGILNWPTVQKIVIENGFDLSQDCLNTCHKNGRLIRSSLGMTIFFLISQSL